MEDDHERSERGEHPGSGEQMGRRATQTTSREIECKKKLQEVRRKGSYELEDFECVIKVMNFISINGKHFLSMNKKYILQIKP